MTARQARGGLTPVDPCPVRDRLEVPGRPSLLDPFGLTGPFRGRQAVAAGLLTRRQLAGPRWSRLLPDVYLSATLPRDHVTWCRAVLLWAPEGVLSGSTALGLYCPTLIPVDLRLDVTVNRVAPGGPARLRTTRSKLAPSEVRLLGGMRVTTPVRTALDIARRADLTQLVITIDALLAGDWLTLAQLREYLLITNNRPGRNLLHEALNRASPGAQSPMESVMRLRLQFGGLPPPRTQHEVVVDGRLVARLDLAYPEFRIGVEYDGDQHRGQAAFQRDLARGNRLQLCGWTVLRFTAADVLQHPDRMVAQVRALLPGGCRERTSAS